MTRFVGPINPSTLPQLTLSFGGFGLLFMAWFILYEVCPSANITYGNI